MDGVTALFKWSFGLGPSGMNVTGKVLQGRVKDKQLNHPKKLFLPGDSTIRGEGFGTEVEEHVTQQHSFNVGSDTDTAVSTGH